MAPGSRHLLLTRVTAVAGLGLAAVLGIVLFRTWNALPPPTTAQPQSAKPLDFADTRTGNVTGSVWTVLAVPSSAGVGSPVTGTRRFRLAGTFLIDGTDAQAQRKAILDDGVRREQQIVGEGDTIAEARVEHIFYDHVTLRIGGIAQDVWLDFSRSHGPVVAPSNLVAAATAVVTTNRFGGVKLQADRWQFSRQGLLNYYQELLEEPDRMVAVFDSLKPVRAADSKITGYVVGVEGEADFFKAVGLNNGDVVRQVNSVPMTSRRRAEFFIDQFLKDRMNVMVLDIERDGQPAKQVYLVRP